MEEQKIKKIKIIAIIAVVAILGISIIFIIKNKIHERYTAKINLAVAPTTSDILLNGKNVSNGIIEVEPGDYTIEVSHDGFESAKQEFSISDYETRRVYFILESNDPSTADWYDAHEEDWQILEAISSWQFDEDSENYVTQHPIVKKLPHTSGLAYSIHYGDCGRRNSDDDFCIIIDADFGYRSNAISHVGRLDDDGDVAKYYIRINGYTDLYQSESVDYDLSELMQSSKELSAGERSNILSAELDAIMTTADIKANSIEDGYTAEVSQIKLLSADCCAISIKATGSNPNLNETYRMILSKIDGEWLTIAKPSLYLSYEENPYISADYIRQTNNL